MGAEQSLMGGIGCDILRVRPRNREGAPMLGENIRRFLATGLGWLFSPKIG